MKRWLTLLLCLMLAMPGVALAEERAELEVTDYLAEQAAADAALLAEGEAGYDFDAPLVVLNPYGGAPLSAVAVFTTEEAQGGTVTVKGHAPEDDITGAFESAVTHFVPIYGLYAGEETQVELKLDDGRETTFAIETEPVSLGFDNYTAGMADEALYDYGQLAICGSIVMRCYGGYDSKGDLRWALTNTGANAITPLDNGHFLVPNVCGHGAEFPNGLTGIREIDLLGKVYNTYVWNGGQHHEIIVLPNGHYLAAGSRPDYATNRDYVFEIDPATGEVVWDLDIASIVRPGSSGCKSDNGADWCHDNALAYDAGSDTLLISCRHLCAVLAVEKQTKALKWILGDPAGWSGEYEAYLLAPEGEPFAWPYAQHQVTLMDNGDILMFDNGTFGRAKAVNEADAIPDSENYSRVAVYRVDADAMTIRQVWSYGEDLGFYADSMSGVECLDEARARYLITYGTCENEDGGMDTHVRLIEGGEPVWNLDYTGSSTYRGTMRALYRNTDYTPGIEGNWRGDIGETPKLEAVDMDLTQAAEPPEGLRVDRFPFDALRFSGVVALETDVQKPECVVYLTDGEQTYCYDLGYTSTDTPDGKKLVFSRWVSLKGLPEGRYGICVSIDGSVYDTGKAVTVG